MKIVIGRIKLNSVFFETGCLSNKNCKTHRSLVNCQRDSQTKFIFLATMEPSIEMERLDTSGNIVEIKEYIDEKMESIKKDISKNRKIMTPMLGVIILGLGLTIGVLSGYLLRLPHQQTNESGQIDLPNPGTFYI